MCLWAHKYVVAFLALCCHNFGPQGPLHSRAGFNNKKNFALEQSTYCIITNKQSHTLQNCKTLCAHYNELASDDIYILDGYIII